MIVSVGSDHPTAAWELPQLSLAVLGQGSEPCHRFRVADPEEDLATHFGCQTKADRVIVHRR
jgi:hypothetical protein